MGNDIYFFSSERGSLVGIDIEIVMEGKRQEDEHG